MWNWQVAGWSNANVRTSWRLRGTLDHSALAAAVDELFRRHEALRTTLHLVRGGVCQRVWPFARPPISEIRIRSARSLDEPEANDVIAAAAAAPFDLRAGGPLCRVYLFRTDLRNDHVLTLVMDHGISDGASAAIVQAELRSCLADAVGRRIASSATPAQFRDYTNWERDPVHRQRAEYFTDRIAPTGCTLSRTGGTTNQPAIFHTFEAGPIVDAEQLQPLISRQRVTVGAVAFAVIAVALSSWTDKALRIGMIGANRFDPTFRSVVGPLFNILPLRIPLNPRSTFAEVLHCTQRELLKALRSNVPLQAMLDLAETETMCSHRIFDVPVNFFPHSTNVTSTIVNHGKGELTIERHTIQMPPGVRFAAKANDGIPIGFDAIEDGTRSLRLTIGANAAVIPQSALRRLNAYLAQVVDRVIERPEVPIAEASASRPPIPELDRHT